MSISINQIGRLCVSILFLSSLCAPTSAENLAPKLTKVSNNLALNTARFGHTVVNDGERIFVMGGRSVDTRFLTDIEIINPATNEVTTLPKKLLGRRFATAVYDGKQSIYLFGGIGRVKRSVTIQHKVEKIDTKTFEVTVLADMPTPRKLASGNMLGHYIVISGGSKFERKRSRKLVATSNVSIFDTKNNRWLEGADMLTAKETKTVLVNNLIYAVGGYDMRQAIATFERFNISTNQWEKLPALPRNMSAHAVAAIGHHIFTFGDYQQMDVTYQLDLTSGIWQKLAVGYNQARHAAATSIGNTLYVIGGTTGSGGSTLNDIQQFVFQ